MNGQIRRSQREQQQPSPPPPDILQLSFPPTPPPLSHLTLIHNTSNRFIERLLSPTSLQCDAYLCPKKRPFSSLTRSTPPDPRWVLYLPGALALCPLLTPISQPLSLAAGNIQAEMLPSRNIVFFTQQQQYTSLGKQCFIDLYPPANTLSNR